MAKVFNALAIGLVHLSIPIYDIVVYQSTHNNLRCVYDMYHTNFTGQNTYHQLSVNQDVLYHHVQLNQVRGTHPA
jgi:hypothetical protein